MALGIEVVTGAFLLIFGLSFLINAGFWAGAFRRMGTDPQQTFTLLWVLLICGVLMVMGHNLWVADWRVIVTITSWAVLIESIFLILVPQIMGMYANWSEKTMVAWLRVGSVLWVAAGGVVTYYSHVG